MNTERLIYMANQIARNFAVQGEEAAIEQTASHIVDFWDPRMKAAIAECGDEGLDDVAKKAIERLRGLTS
jgi:formate dehydrogenase subunit delta